MSTLAERWGAKTLGFGFTGVPNLLLRINSLEQTKGSERLSSAEMFVLISILEHWKSQHLHPYPSLEQIARHTALSYRHVRRLARALVAKNYLTVHRHGELDGRRKSFNPRPLVNKLEEAAKRLGDDLDSAIAEESISRLEIADRLGFFSFPKPRDAGGA